MSDNNEQTFAFQPPSRRSEKGAQWQIDVVTQAVTDLGGRVTTSKIVQQGEYRVETTKDRSGRAFRREHRPLCTAVIVILPPERLSERDLTSAIVDRLDEAEREEFRRSGRRVWVE